MRQAYLQSAENLERDIFVKPCREFHLDADTLLKLLNPMYGLSESGDYWGGTFRKHLLNNIGMESCVSEPALLFKHLGQELSGMCGTYVDDTLQAGNDGYSHLCLETEKCFNCK